MKFTEYLNESHYYHGTTLNNANSILINGPDPKRYKSGMFIGFYLAPNLSYFSINKPQAILQFDIDDSKIMPMGMVSDDKLAQIDPSFRSMSYGYKNSLIQKLAGLLGYGGLNTGHETILFNNSPIIDIKLLDPNANTTSSQPI